MFPSIDFFATQRLQCYNLPISFHSDCIQLCITWFLNRNLLANNVRPEIQSLKLGTNKFFFLSFFWVGQYFNYKTAHDPVLPGDSKTTVFSIEHHTIDLK